MKVENISDKRQKRSWSAYARAFGRAHGKARQELETSMPLLTHLEELRKRTFRAFVAVLITTLLSFVFAGRLIDFFASPLGGRQALVSIEVTENMAIFMRVSLLSGLVLGMPFVVYEALRFILPGLKSNEKIWLILGVPAASLLFLGGVAFTWFVLIPAAVPFLVNFLEIPTEVRPQNYFQFITSLMFWIGLFFEMPLVVFLLAKLNLVSAKQLLQSWRYAVVVMAVVAGGVTPTVDPVNMGLVMAPLAVLYIISILLAALARRK